MTSYDDFAQARGQRPGRASKYRDFLAGIEPGEVREWPLGDAKADSVRSAMRAAALWESINDLQTAVRDGVLLVARPPEGAEPPVHSGRARRSN